MKKIIFILLVISSLNLFSQQIIWETVIDSLNENNPMNTNVKEDYNNDYIIGISDNYMRNPILAKIKNDGKLNFLKMYHFDYSASLKKFFVNDDGSYFIFNSSVKDTNRVSKEMKNKYVPQILIIDTAGSIIDVRNSKGLFDSLTFSKEFYFDKVINNNKFIIKNSKIYIIGFDDLYHTNQCFFKVYSSDCTMLMKKEFDTNTNYINSFYNGFFDNNDGNLVVVRTHQKPMLPSLPEKELVFLTIDTNGNTIKTQRIPIENKNLPLYNFFQFNDNSYYCIGTLPDNKFIDYHYRINNNKDSIVEIKSLSVKYSDGIDKSLKLSDGNFIECGFYAVYRDPSHLPAYDTSGFYLRKLNSKFELIWEKYWEKSNGDFYLNDVIEDTKGDLVVSGLFFDLNKYSYNVYVAKIKDSSRLINGNNRVCENSINKYTTKNDINYLLKWEIVNGTIIDSDDKDSIDVIWNNAGEGILHLIRNNLSTNIIDTSYLYIKVDIVPSKPDIKKQGDTLISNYDIGNQWYLNGSPILSEKSRIYIPKENGKYSIKVTLKACESEMSDEIDTGTSVNDENKEFALIPNPASDYIEISVGAQRAVPDKVAIFDVLGVEVQKSMDSRFRGNDSHFPEGTIRIDVSSLSPGVYFVKIGDVVRKFVKM